MCGNTFTATTKKTSFLAVFQDPVHITYPAT